MDKASKRSIEALAPVDHASAAYEPFAKDFYDESPEIFAMDDAEVQLVVSRWTEVEGTEIEGGVFCMGGSAGVVNNELSGYTGESGGNRFMPRREFDQLKFFLLYLSCLL